METSRVVVTTAMKGVTQNRILWLVVVVRARFVSRALASL